MPARIVLLSETNIFSQKVWENYFPKNGTVTVENWHLT